MLRKGLKWVGIILGGLVGLLVVAVIALYLLGTSRNNWKYEVQVAPITVPTDAQSVARGKHLATILICTNCHTENMGGKVEFEIPGMLSIPTPNLTSGAGGVAAAYTDEDWVRAIRHGIGHDGRALFIMPSKAYTSLSDEDLGAIIAYLKSLPAVDSTLPERKIELVAQLMTGAGMFPPYSVEQIDHASPRPPAPPPGVTAAYGEYLSRTCTECHGASLNGAPFGPPGQEIVTPNLTPGGEISIWSEGEFIKFMRTGATRSGRTVSDDMPWQNYGVMTDDELRALWLYLQSLPASEQGG